jgi:hypothetical protein
MQSWFDVEIQAKTVFNDMQREVERARLVQEALSGGRRAGNGQQFTLARLLNGARSWLAMREPVRASAVEPALPEAANVSLIVSSEQNAAPRVRPVASAEPYAGMLVLARGKHIQALKAASSARER